MFIIIYINTEVIWTIISPHFGKRRAQPQITFIFNLVAPAVIESCEIRILDGTYL